MPANKNQTTTKTNSLHHHIEWVRGVAEAFGTSEVQLHALELFLRAAEADLASNPLDSRDLVKATGLASSSVSRIIGALGERDRMGRPGMGLLSAIPDYHDRRRKPVRLTAKGRQLVKLIGNL